MLTHEHGLPSLLDANKRQGRLAGACKPKQGVGTVLFDNNKTRTCVVSVYIGLHGCNHPCKTKTLLRVGFSATR